MLLFLEVVALLRFMSRKPSSDLVKNIKGGSVSILSVSRIYTCRRYSDSDHPLQLILGQTLGTYTLLILSSEVQKFRILHAKTSLPSFSYSIIFKKVSSVHCIVSYSQKFLEFKLHKFSDMLTTSSALSCSINMQKDPARTNMIL